jgi:hypothetical protein
MLISIGVPLGEATGELPELTGADDDPTAAGEDPLAALLALLLLLLGAAAEELPELGCADDDPLALLFPLLLHAVRLPATRPPAMSAIPQLFNLTT